MTKLRLVGNHRYNLEIRRGLVIVARRTKPNLQKLSCVLIALATTKKALCTDLDVKFSEFSSGTCQRT
jgi:hypothetical protein